MEQFMTRRFREGLRQHLRRELPEETKEMTDQHILGLIDDGIARGCKYGIITERDLTLFVDLLFAHSPNFDEAPDMRWAKKILLNNELDGEAKMSLIYQHLAAKQAPPEGAQLSE